MRRSMLFMPGSNPGNMLNATVFGADAVIIDLEDAVAFTEKDAARILTRNALAETDFNDTEVIIRINSLGTPFWQADLDMIIPQKPDTIMPTKVNSGEDIKRISAYMEKVESAAGIPVGRTGLIPLIESALGIENALEIARADKRVVALYLGAEDLALDIHARRTLSGHEIRYSRSRIVMAARAAGIEVLDTPFLDTSNNENLRADAQLAREMGFSGKAAIYPLQVEIINEVFSPSEKEYQHALEVLAVVERAKTQGKGVSTLNGSLIDGPVITRAEILVKEYEEIKGGVK